MTDFESPSPAINRSSVTANLCVAVLFLLQCIWLAVADFGYKGDLILQTSPSLTVVAAFVSIWFFASIIVAVFPKRIVIGAAILFTIRSCMGWPLNIWMENSPACKIFTGLLLLLAIYYFYVAVKQLIRIPIRPWIRWQHSVLLFVLSIGISVASIPWAVFGLTKAGENLVGDYTKLTFKGVVLKERVFEKDGKKVFLIGMMHMGDPSFYKDFTKRAAVAIDGKRLVLTECVSDSKEILPKNFASGQTYSKLAEKLGLTAQQEFGPGEKRPEKEKKKLESDWDELGVTFKNADIDVSQLSEKHQGQLVELLGLMDVENLSELFTTTPENLTGPDIEDLMFSGLIGTRNDYLMEVFDAELAGFDEIYIPWGAAHLPDVEERLLKRGFTQIEEHDRFGIRFWKNRD